MFSEYRERVRVFGGSKRKMSHAAAVRALLRFALLSKGCKGKPVAEIPKLATPKQQELFGKPCDCTSAAMHAVLCQSKKT
jgi:hypothetical protein